MLRVHIVLFAMRDEVPCADSDMANLIVKDSFENTRACLVTRCANPLQHRRGDVKAPGFQHHRHNGKARGDIVACFRGSFPQPIVRGQSPVKTAHCP